MPVDIEARLARLEQELLSARGELQHLRRGVRRRRRLAQAALVGIALVTGWAARTETAVRSDAPDDPIAKLNKKLTAVTQQLQAKIEALELRVHKLEVKPDNVDNDDEKKAGRTANPGQAGGTEASAEQPSGAGRAGVIFRAPFIVTDSQGSALFTVTENGMRGVKVFSGGVARVTLEASDEGGDVKALAPNLGEVALSARENLNEVFVTGPIGGHAASMRGSHEGGQLSVGSQGGRGAVLGAFHGPMGLRFIADPDGQKSLGGIGIMNDGSTGVSLRGPSGNQSVVLGSATGSDLGFAQVFDNGTLRAELSASDNGLIAVRNDGGKAVAYLTRSSGGGGNMTTTDPAGNGVVSAGFAGSDQADICLDRKQHLICVGVNLPLSMSR